MRSVRGTLWEAGIDRQRVHALLIIIHVAHHDEDCHYLSLSAKA